MGKSYKTMENTGPIAENVVCAYLPRGRKT